MILFAGDPHGQFDHLYPFLQQQKDIALVILGDLQLSSPTELDKLAQYCDLWFIHGNHDSKTVAAFDAIWGTQWRLRTFCRFGQHTPRTIRHRRRQYSFQPAQSARPGAVRPRPPGRQTGAFWHSRRTNR